MSSEYYSKDEIRRFARKVIRPVVIVLFVILIAAPLLGFFIQFLWNATIANMFGLPSISFWQAVGLFILAKFLFGFGGSSSGSSGRRSGRRKGRKTPRSASATADEASIPDDEAFRDYWKEEGKEAYDAFLTEGDAIPDEDKET